MSNVPERDLTTFKRIMSDMILKNGRTENTYSFYKSRRTKEYTKEEVERIINGGSLEAQQLLSRNFFLKDGLYKRILIYYATLLQYAGILIPNPIAGNELSTPHIKKRYESALDYVEKMCLPELLTRISLRVLIDGCYYGLLKEASKTDFIIIDLPAAYCRSYYTDLHGNDIIEFNVNYFNSINDEDTRKKVLTVYPKVVADHYRRFKKNQVKTSWVRIPSDIGFCFPLFDGRPPFLDLIVAVMDYDQAKDINREKDLEEIRKILVQKIPHLTDGTLLFEPPEAEVMHEGAVGMMSGNKNISVLTTYADVDAVVSKTSSEATTNTLEKNLQNVYSMASVSGQLFSPTGTQALSSSITNDMAFMMVLVNKYNKFITFILNSLFANSNINFKYTILPLTWYNVSTFITDTFKLAQSGYSFLIPGIASGISQKDLINLKKLEKDSLKLGELLEPLTSAYTQSNNPVGRPTKPVEEKSPKTLQNEESLNNQ